MENKLARKINSLRVSFLFLSALLVTVSGCLHSPPVLLRNRPNVPPPIVKSSDDNQIMSIGTPENIATLDTPLEIPMEIIAIPKSLPPPDITTAPLTYTVKKGDSFWKVARMYGVTQAELAISNNLSLKKPLRAGSVLLIPPGGEFVAADKRPKIKKSTTPPKTVKTPKPDYVPTLQDGKYTVQPGDNLWKIARTFNTTTSLLMQANGLNSKSVLQVGKTLIIPGAGDSTTPAKQPEKTTPEQPEPPPETLDDPSVGNDADDLLKDAEDSTSGTSTVTTTPEDDAGAVIDEIDKAQDVIDNTETPGSLYTEEVLPNETLQDIADRHDLTTEELRALNPGLPEDGKLKPFTSIKIPK